MHGSHVSFRMKLAKKTNTSRNVWGLSEGLTLHGFCFGFRSDRDIYIYIERRKSLFSRLMLCPSIPF